MANARSWYDAFFGQLYNTGAVLELLGGVNFVGFTITADEVNGYYTITNPAAANASAGAAHALQTSNGSGGFVDGGATLVSGALAGVTKLNGATVVAPTEGVLTDASTTKNISDGAQQVLPAATLTTNRTLTLGTSGSPITDDTIVVVRLDATANTYAIANGGAGGGTLFTFPASVKGMMAFKYDGTNWVKASGFVRLQ